MTLNFYLSRFIGVRILTAWLALALLGISIDLFRAANDIIALGGAVRLLEYVVYRTPQIMVTLFPVATLVGATLAFSSLKQHQEVVILRASGSGMLLILTRLLPLAILLGLFYSQGGDRIQSWTAQKLAFSFPETKKEAPVNSWVWARDGNNIVRARVGRDDGTLLKELIVYETDEKGHIHSRLSADQVIYEDGQWRLSNPVRIPSTGDVEKDNEIWSTRLLPQSVREIASKSIDVSADDARASLDGSIVATRSNSYYATRIARSYSAIALPFVTLMLAALAGLGSLRGNERSRPAIYAIVLGFCYITLDGMLGSLGETGFLLPYVAALTPTVLFTITGLWGLIMLDG